MNYLTHFYHNYFLLNHTADSAGYYWGIVIPDLVKVYHHQIRFPLRTITQQAEAHSKFSLWDGIRNHLLADQSFHQASFFTDLQKRYASVIYQLRRKHSEALTKTQERLFIHIGIELLFDHHLITLHPDLAEKFYQTLDRISPQAIIHQWQPDLSSSDGLIQHFQNFLDARYLSFYNDLHAIARTLQYKMRRFPPPFPDTRFIYESLKEIRPEVFHRACDLIHMLKTII